MNRFINGTKGRIILSLLVLLVVGVATTILSYSDSSEPFMYVKTEVDILYEKLLNQDDENLISKKYLVKDNSISKILPNTKIEDFKKEFNKDIKIYKNEQEVSTGLVESGMIVKYKDESRTILVHGDTNNDGIVDTETISNDFILYRYE